MPGTSPRTRGKQGLGHLFYGNCGNIPAHAGKTPITHPFSVFPAEHPRARGENSSVCRIFNKRVGTSPRTRGKRDDFHFCCGSAGNIPAHAGKTLHRNRTTIGPAEHPRARGENRRASRSRSAWTGTSPRTRGKQPTPYRLHGSFRNIPAHAGKTVSTSTCVPSRREHPRARGENS